MWIGCHYYYTESDIKQIYRIGHLSDTYGWEQRMDERLDVAMATKGLRKLGIDRPNCKQIADYLNGVDVP